MARLRRDDFARTSDDLAPRLIGCSLVRRLPDGTELSGVIIEAEAYLGPDDQASHARNGHRSARNESMYGRPGTGYVYFTYGMHHCLNVVCAAVGVPQAVLIRALRPLAGLERMRAHRARRGERDPASIRERDLCSGPGRLCQAMAIDRALDGIDLLRSNELRLAPGPGWPDPHPGLRRTPRIGLGPCGEWAGRPLRWVLVDPTAGTGPPSRERAHP